MVRHYFECLTICSHTFVAEWRKLSFCYMIPQIPYIFNQLCQFLDRQYFDYLVKKYNGNRYVKHFTCWNHLLAMVWAQITDRRSLRDIEYSLRAHKDKLYRMGIGRSVSRSTLAEANSSRDVGIYRGMALRMMEKASGIRAVRADLEEVYAGLAIAGFYAVDSSTVHLPLSKFPWSVPQRNGGGIKIHTMYDILREIPSLCNVTGNEERDQTFMDDYTYNPSCLYLFDKAYVKTASLYGIHRKGAYFIVRKKDNMRLELVSSDEGANARCPMVLKDSRVRFVSRWARKGYPQDLRLVSYYSPEKNGVMMFLTNNFDMDAELVAYANKNRWAIETFFKWLKQHLHIESFFGHSANAVSIQVYSAIIAFCMIALCGDEHRIRCSNYELLRALSVSLTERTHLCDWVRGFQKSQREPIGDSSQLTLFDGNLLLP